MSCDPASEMVRLAGKSVTHLSTAVQRPSQHIETV
jgi:hypothetical protein